MSGFLLYLKVLAILCLTLVVPIAAAGFVFLRAATHYLEATQANDRRVQSASTESQESAEREAIRHELSKICDRDAAIERTLMALSAGRVERDVANELDAELPQMARAYELNVVSVFAIDSPESHRFRSLAHAGARPTELRSLAENASASGDEGFIARIHGEDHLLQSCVANRAAARVLVVGGRPIVTLPDPESTELDAHSDHARRISQLRIGYLGVCAAAVAYAILFAWWVTRAMRRPLAEIEAATRRVARGELDSAIRSNFGGQADRTMGAFNRMTEELNRTQQRLLRAERIAAWRDIARRIAHEIKNPLLPIQMSIETMQKTYASRHPDFDEIFRESTSTILEEVDRLKLIVTEFSRFARMPKPNAEELDVREIVQHVVGMHASGAAAVTAVLPPTLRKVRADRDQLTQVLVNLVQNGMDAATSHHANTGSPAVVLVEVHDVPDRNAVQIVVTDNGPGIPLDARANVFEPYFTTKAHGTGLGLAIVHRIVSDHGGTIDIHDAKTGGAEIQITLTTEGPPQEAETSTTGVTL